MKQNNIVIAPQSSNALSLYPQWLETHTGSRDDFYFFMTTPSVERSLFLADCQTTATLTKELMMEDFI